MNFAFILTNLAGGGAEKAILKLAAALTGRGHRAEVVLLEDRVEHAVPAGVTVFPLGGRAAHGWLGKRLLARRLRRHLIDRPDLVVSTLPFADEVAVLADLPHHWCRIANTLGSEIDKLAAASPAKARRRLARYRRLYGSRPLIAVSAGVAVDLRQSLALASRIETIPNAFDFAAMRQAAAEPVADLPTGPYVLHVGRFAPQKRHELLLDAWARIATDRQLVLLTEPDARLQTLIDVRGLGQRVRVAGFHANPYPWLAGADLLVLCSDGLTRHVEDGEIAAIAGDERPDVAADILVRLARERGGEDNITVAIIQHGERLEESTRPTARLATATVSATADAPTAPIPAPATVPPPGPRVAMPVPAATTREHSRSLWPLTFALAAIMVVLILVLWVVVQRATTI